MKYPDKYPDGFMAAAVEAKIQGDKQECNKILLESIKFFRNFMQREVYGLREADASLVMVALTTLCKALRTVTPDNGALADALVDNVVIKETIIKFNPKTFNDRRNQ